MSSQAGDMTTTLITGANKGLGREAARRLLDLGHDVYIGARDRELGQAAADVLGARFIQLDVTDESSVTAAADQFAAEVGSLDVLVNNAGIAGGFIPAAETTAAHLRTVYETNVLGMVTVLHAFLPLLEKSANPVVVNVSSGLGSLAITTDPSRHEYTLTGIAYPSSKAAVNMVTSQYAKAFPRMRINCVDPGYTGTDLNAHRGTQTVQEGTDAIVAMATIGPDGPTGTFSDRNGPAPW
jgi:NAD(P)-dependent dehydrogenase (short-subunit alcohol dehydrogenase family)